MKRCGADVLHVLGLKSQKQTKMRIAITGGIGSGKSYVCREIERHGFTVYDCDSAAKRLMRSDADLQQALCRLVGDEVCRDGVLQKAVLAEFLLASEDNKQALNAVVHPAVARDFMKSGLVWCESAILFESRFDERVTFDKVVCVTAPVETRVERVMKRDGISREKALAWIEAQMPERDIVARSNWQIVNDGKADVKDQVEDLLNKLSLDSLD